MSLRYYLIYNIFLNSSNNYFTFFDLISTNILKGPMGSSGLLHKTEKQYSWHCPAELTPVDLFQPVECFSVGPVRHNSLWVPFTRDWESHDRPAGTFSPPPAPSPWTHTDTNPQWSPHWPASLSLIQWEGYERVCVCVLGVLFGLPVLAFLL